MSQSAQVIELLADTAGQSIHDEAITAAASAIKPGMLVEELADGTVQEHSSSGGKAQPLFALTDLPVAADIDTAYAVGTLARYGSFSPGQGVNAFVPAAAVAIVKSDKLVSNGDGALRKALDAVAATITVAGGDANGDLLFTAVTAGADGNAIQIVIETPTASPSVVVAGSTITIIPDSTTPTATEVVAQIVASVPATNLVTASAPGTGATAPGTNAGVNLTGGADAEGNVVARAQEAVDNSGGGSIARIKARVA